MYYIEFIFEEKGRNLHCLKFNLLSLINSIIFVVFFITRKKSLIRYPNLLISCRIKISPKSVKYVASVPYKPRKGTQMVINLDSKIKDLNVALEKNYKAITARQIIVEQKNWIETHEYKYMIENGFSIKNAENYIKKTASMYSSFIHHGFKERLYDKICTSGLEVGINSEGELVKLNSGNHRFYGSYYANLNEIPVSLCFMDESFYNNNFKNKSIFDILFFKSYLKKLYIK